MTEAGELAKKSWTDVKVGDVVLVHNREHVPADIVALASSEAQNVCYIETSNLDGETNLKLRQGLPETGEWNTPAAYRDLKVTVNCNAPNKQIYQFDGYMQIVRVQNDVLTLPLEPKQLLLRGSVLRNTEWLYAVVVFSGHETKLMMNANDAPTKWTNVERKTNRYILMIFCFQILLVLLSCAGRGFWGSRNERESTYLRTDDDYSPWGDAAISFVTFLILYNNLIPISLYVSMELVKVWQAYLIDHDVQMYYEVNDTPAKARTSNLNEELGQIEYIFSDKTGTLTRNMMEFRKCSIGGIAYGSSEDMPESMRHEGIDPSFNFYDERLLDHLHSGHRNADTIEKFLTSMAVCHTVIPERTSTPGHIEYQAQSPDEAALVSAAKAFDYVFSDREADKITVTIDGKDSRWTVLNVLAFTSSRKRMSVIVRERRSGKIMLYCKGADNVIAERLAPGQDYLDEMMEHLRVFAAEGLRTLVFAEASIDEAAYREWAAEFAAASTALDDREGKLAKVAEKMERNLELVGATAIEDKLQVGVPETIHRLAAAGIKIWVLTGDKQETAINIGHSCHLLRTDMKVMIVNELSDLGTLARIDTYNKEKVGVDPDNLALVINGTSLHHALAICPKAFVRLAKNCKAVICCRVSPLQKALVVELIKKNLNTITLAIGDGANDVGMLTAAHVGVGISGEEGLQAVRSSDYSIAQFRFLERLLLIHGRHSYRRIAKLICYSFYKNILLYMTQFWYIFENGYSGQSLYEGWTIAVYNIFFTSLPILVLAILDKDVSDRMVSKYPRIYRFGQKHVFLTGRIFWGWTLNALFHSLLVYLLISNIWRGGSLDSGGQGFGLMDMGMVMYICVVIIVTLKLGLETYYWTIYNHVAMWGSLVAVVIFFGVYCTAWSWGFLSLAPSLYWVFMRLFVTPVFWWAILLVPTVALLRDIGWKAFMRAFRPKVHHLLQEMAVKKRRRRDPDPENGKSNDDAVGGHRHGHSAHHGHHGHHHHGHHHHGHHNSHASADGAKGKGKHSSHNHHHHHHHHHRRTLSNQHSRHHGSHHARGRQSPRIGAFNPLRLSPPPSSMPPGVEMTTTIPTTPNKLATREETIGGGQTMASGSAVGVPAHLPPLVGSGSKRAPKVPPPSVVVAPPIEPDDPMQRVSVLDDDAISEADHRRTRSHS